jgi:hypothetical protein
MERERGENFPGRYEGEKKLQLDNFYRFSDEPATVLTG